MKALALAIALALAVSSVKANTSIVQFDRPACVSGSRQAAAAETVSKDWPILTPSVQPSLFTVWPPAAPDIAEYWLTLRFNDDDEKPGSSALDRLKRALGSLASTRYAVRASHPANHPLDLDMAVYKEEEMLQAGGVAVEAQSSPTAAGTDAKTQPCRVAYLHLKASRGKAVSIPPPRSSAPSSWLMTLVERYYLGPLATGQHSDEPTPTPIHLTLDPLVFGIAPWSLTLGSPLFVLLLLVIVFVAGPALARVLEKRIQDIVAAHAKTD